MDFHHFDLVGCGVHLGHNDVSAVFVFLAELLPDGSQLFAVSTPRRIWNIKQRQLLSLNESSLQIKGCRHVILLGIVRKLQAIILHYRM